MEKATKILSILLVCWQIPMLFLWHLTYETIRLKCHKLEVYPGGRYELVFKPELVAGELWQNAPIILALMACLILPLVSMILVFCKKGTLGTPALCCLGLSILACGCLILVFKHPSLIGDENRRYLVCEYVFYRYMPEDVFHISPTDFYGCNLIDIFPLLEQIKFIIIAVHGALSGVLMGLGISQVVSRRKQKQAPVSTEQETESATTSTPIGVW